MRWCNPRVLTTAAVQTVLQAAAVVLAMVGSAMITLPARAEVPFTSARVRSSSNQVNLVSSQGTLHPATTAACLCPGDRLRTNAVSRAEVLFNDGSLVRVGERSVFRFLPKTRQLHLSQGTAAVFVPPSLGRTTLQTPNATVGLNSSGVVVRYLPSRGLTLVLALVSSATGPISLTLGTTGEEVALAAGQMAFVEGNRLRVVEFDLREFYQTSNLVAGLHLANPNYRGPADEPLATLRPDLLQALGQQLPFDGREAILDPASISEVEANTHLLGDAAVSGQPYPDEVLRLYNSPPAGVVAPLPSTL
jgi:hypothetical protein